MIQKLFFLVFERKRAKKGVVSRLLVELTEQKIEERSRVTTPFKIVQAIHLFSRLFSCLAVMCHVSPINHHNK